MNKFDMMGKDAFNRVEEIMNATKLNEFLHRKEEEEKKKTCVLWILAIIGVIAAVAAMLTECTASLHQIILRISKMTLKTILTMTFSMRKRQKQ